MPAKQFKIEKVGTIHVSKRKGAKSLRLSIDAAGKVRVTVPFWASYADGVQFAHSRSSWIKENLPEQTGLLSHGQHIGKAHRLIFEKGEVEQVRTRLAGSEIRIIRPTGMTITHPEIQNAAARASVRALRIEAEKLLPVRLKQLALKYGFEYGDVTVKQLKGRWGSCDTNSNITLNLFLMQIPWQLIDYVLIHELTHTKHLNHSSDFWDEFLRHEPRAKIYRKHIRIYKPILVSTDNVPAVA